MDKGLTFVVGEKVLCKFDSSSRVDIGVVERVTKTQIVVRPSYRPKSECGTAILPRFRSKDGFMVGDLSSNRSYITKWNQSEADSIEAKDLQARTINMMHNKSFTLDQMRRVVAILKEAKDA